LFHINLNSSFLGLFTERRISVLWENGGSTFESVLVLIASLNEEEGIGLTLEEIKNFVKNPSFLVVDGYSTDNTVEIAKNLEAQIMFQRGKGKGAAIAQAVELANFDGSYVIMIDADFTYPAKFIPMMIQILEENPRVGMVCGNRFNSHFHMEAMSDMFYVGNRILAFTHNMLNGVGLRDPLSGLRAIRWNILKGWKPKSSGFDIEVELNHHVERKGYEIAEIPIYYRTRLGQKKLKLRHGVTILKRIITESIY
jgi:glycosyltransferase involved in cell wall biosynthesis